MPSDRDGAHSSASPWVLSLAMLAMAMLLNGCYAPLIEGGQQGYDAVKREPLKTDVKTSDDPADPIRAG